MSSHAEPPRERGSIEISHFTDSSLPFRSPLVRGGVLKSVLDKSFGVDQEPPRERGSIEIEELKLNLLLRRAPS